MTTEELVKEVEGKIAVALACLGDTPEKWAGRMYTAGVKGECGNGERCALTLYLIMEAQPPHNLVIEVDEEYVNVARVLDDDGWRTIRRIDDYLCRVELPPAGVKFVSSFDEGKYPLLIA